MKRPWHAWLIYGMCVFILMAVMMWITATMKRLERENQEGQRMASLEETVRLALWRMDAAISPLIIEESARPYVDYAAFKPANTWYPASQEQETVPSLVPSPLLTKSSSNVFTYFNYRFSGEGDAPQITSPQVPDGELRTLALANIDLEQQFYRNSGLIEKFSARVSGDALRQAFEYAASPQKNTSAEAEGQRLSQESGTPSSNSQLSQNDAIGQQIAIQNINEWSARKGQQDKAQSKVQRIKQSSYDSFQLRSRKTPSALATQQAPFQLPFAAKAIQKKSCDHFGSKMFLCWRAR
jgi:hypothetical protein